MDAVDKHIRAFLCRYRAKLSILLLPKGKMSRISAAVEKKYGFNVQHMFSVKVAVFKVVTKGANTAELLCYVHFH
jgi:hypothetical protein